MTRRVRVAADTVAGSWAARIYLLAVVIAYVVGLVAEVTTPPENGASFGFLYLIVFTLPWSFLLPSVLTAVPSDAVESWLLFVSPGLGAVVNALAITLVSRHISHALRPPGSSMESVTPADLPSRIRSASRLVVGSWPARVYLGVLAVAYGYGVVSEVTGDGTGYVYLALVALPWGLIPLPGEWSWVLLLVAGGLINAAFITVLSRVHRNVAVRAAASSAREGTRSA
jgi:hypothetical protein